MSESTASTDATANTASTTATDATAATDASTARIPMSRTDAPNSFPERSMVRRYRRLMGPAAWGHMRTSMTLGAVAGALWGLALLLLLPASVTLATGDAYWGLGLGGWLVVLAVIAVVAAVVDFSSQRIGMIGAPGVYGRRPPRRR